MIEPFSFLRGVMVIVGSVAFLLALASVYWSLKESDNLVNMTYVSDAVRYVIVAGFCFFAFWLFGL